MGSVPGRARHLESAVSFCLLAVLFIIGVVIFIKQSDYDMSRFGISTAVIELSSQPPAVTREEKPTLVSLKPQGFNALSETEVYEPENLYEKINGKAPLYIDSGFVKLFTQRFISESDEDLWMEMFVYDMATTRNAFSVFSVQRRADADLLSLWHPWLHYRTSNALYFIHGNYYIELLGSSESRELFNAIIKTGQKIMKDLLVSDSSRITELHLFPTEDMLRENGIKLYLANAFGFVGLTGTFTAQYRINGETVTAFFSKQANPSDAKTMAESYRKFLIENGAVTKKAANDTLQGSVLDFYNTTEIIFALEPFVAGIHEAESQPSAEKLAVRLANKLSQAAKELSNDKK